MTADDMARSQIDGIDEEDALEQIDMKDDYDALVDEISELESENDDLDGEITDLESEIVNNAENEEQEKELQLQITVKQGRIVEIEAEIEKKEAEKQSMADNAIDKLRDKLTDEIYDELDDPFEYFVNEQGLYSAEDFFKAGIGSIDIDEAAEAAIREDSVGHFLAGYDGNQIDLDGGAVAYRTN